MSRRTVPEQPRFLNVDLELGSDADLAPLAAFWGDRVSVLERWAGRVAFEVHVDNVPDERRAEVTLRRLLDLVEALPAALRALWDGCTLRAFDLGYESGVGGTGAARTHQSRLDPETLARVAAVGASLAVTVWAAESDRPG